MNRSVPQRCRVAALIAMLFVAQAMADGPTTPTPYPTRAEDWPGSGVIRVFGWMNDNRKAFWRVKDQHQGAVVFAGDSLTANWRTLATDFPDLRVANRGIGGDVSRGLLFRFKEDVLDLHPAAVVILIGTNDLTAKQSATATLANIELMLQAQREQSVTTPVILCTTPPSAQPQAPVNARERQRLNEGLAAIAARDDHVTVVDLFAALARADGTPDPRFFKPDQLHLSKEGYARWAQALAPALQRMGLQ